jgi:hypothetical protein
MHLYSYSVMHFYSYSAFLFIQCDACEEMQCGGGTCMRVHANSCVGDEARGKGRVGGQAHSVAQASSRADFSKNRHRIVMGGLRSMRAQELQCVGGACMRVHASTCE